MDGKSYSSTGYNEHLTPPLSVSHEIPDGPTSLHSGLVRNPVANEIHDDGGSPMEVDDESGETSGSGEDEEPLDMDNVPDLNEAKLHKIPQLMRLYNEYASAYGNPDATTESHLERAKTLGLALLKHFFPAGQDFVVEPYAFPLTTTYGISVEMKLPKAPTAKTAKGKRARGRVKNDTPAVTFQYGRWHSIPPEAIAGFVVKKTYYTDAEDGTRTATSIPHTYLGICIDDLSTKPEWVPYNRTSSCPADMIGTVLGLEASIEAGIGIMIMGPTIEFYTYTAKEGRYHQIMHAYGGQNSVLEMTEANAILINQMFDSLVQTKIEYDKVPVVLEEVDGLGKGVVKVVAGRR